MSEPLDLHAPLEPGWWQPPPGDPDHVTWPYRLVDRNWLDWVHIGQGRYQAAYHREPNSTYPRIDAEHGPLRHLIAMPDGDWETLAVALVAARYKAIGSLLVALGRLVSRHRDNPRRLIAGRSGSWESEGMLQIGAVVGIVFDRHPRNYDQATVQLFVDTIQRWTHGYPRYYVEVAENLNSIVGDAIERARGWDNLCLPPLRRGAALPHQYAQLVQGHFDGMHEYRQYLDIAADAEPMAQDGTAAAVAPVEGTPLHQLWQDLLVHAAESQPAEIRPVGPDVLCLAADCGGTICNLPAGHVDQRTGTPSVWHAEVLTDGSTWAEWRGAAGHMPCHVPPDHPIRRAYQQRADADAEV